MPCPYAVHGCEAGTLRILSLLALTLISFDHILIMYFHPDIQRTNYMAPVASVHSPAQEWIQAQKVDSHQEV